MGVWQTTEQWFEGLVAHIVKKLFHALENYARRAPEVDSSSENDVSLDPSCHIRMTMGFLSQWINIEQSENTTVAYTE